MAEGERLIALTTAPRWIIVVCASALCALANSLFCCYSCLDELCGLGVLGSCTVGLHLRLRIARYSTSFYFTSLHFADPGTRVCHDDWYQDGILFICSQTRRRPVRRGKKSLRKAMQNHPDYPVPALSAPIMLVDVESSRDCVVRESSRHRCASSTPVVGIVGTFSGAGVC